MTITKETEWDEDIEDTGETEEPESDASHFEIMNYPADTTLSGYRDQWDNKQLIIPEFQRKYVWDQVRASKLIESFLLGLPVPGIFLYKERDNAKYLVIDGNQRINTVVSFFKGVFKDKKFKLKGVLPKWEGKSFDDLSEQEQFKLSTAVMRATIIQQLNPNDSSSIYYIFERLNTGGVNLNPMEVRMCVSEGDFTKLLKELNQKHEWRAVLAKPVEDQRARDIELLLRIFALNDTTVSYEKPMKGFLNNYIASHKDAPEDWINNKRNIFTAALSRAFLLPPKPFHLKGKLNYAVLDAIMVALMDSTLSEKDELQAAYTNLITDADFLDAVAVSTSDKINVLSRIERARHYFG